MTEQQLTAANNVAFRMRNLVSAIKSTEGDNWTQVLDECTPETRNAVRTLVKADLSNQLAAAREQLGAM